MNVSRTMSLLLLVAAFTGCKTSTKQISNREIADDVEGKQSIYDVKIEKYEELVREFPGEPKHRERLAGFYFKRGRYEEALEQLEIGQKLDDNNAYLFYMQGQIQQELGNYQLAEVSYKHVIDKMGDDRYTGPHYDLAWLYTETRRFDKALEQFERCLEIDPLDPLPYYFMGKLFAEQVNKPKQAVKCFEEYMRLGGERYHREAYAYLFRLQPDLKRPREGDPLSESEAANTPPDPE